MTDIRYSTIKAVDLTDEQIKKCSTLFNNNYGVYRSDSPTRPKKQIKFPLSIYEKYRKPEFYVAMAKDGDDLVGHAFYIRKRYPKYGILTWVLQLVVDVRYRKKRIASTLLHSIWGFSDDFGWGLASANPCTVHTLESATFRECNPGVILENIDAVRTICDDIEFIDIENIDVSDSHSVVNTKFFVDNASSEGERIIGKKLGDLCPGYEWLAMTFQTQELCLESAKKHFEQWMEFSERKLKEAYSRMDMPNQGWAHKTSDEVDFLKQYLQSGTVLDLGCGIGRHALALAEEGFIVKGVDFAVKHIEYAKQMKAKTVLQNIDFEVCDIRKYINNGQQFDNVICLFDVVGSFPKDEDNEKIIRVAYENLKLGGVLVLSVMNMELTEKIVPMSQRGCLRDRMDILFALRPSNTMQSSGNIFNGELLAIDTTESLVYRKEQFDNNDELSAEYIIRDKRYRLMEICSILEGIGFKIEKSIYTRAGFKDELKATDEKAKEILIVARKIE